jgi:hypothetical protein
MNRAAAARSYLERVQLHDGAGAAELFTVDAVIDDAGGGHHSGRAEIARFVDSIRELDIRDVLVSFEEGSRLTIFGKIRTTSSSDALIRWVFQFDDDLIAHLGNSYVRAVPPARPQ